MSERSRNLNKKNCVATLNRVGQGRGKGGGDEVGGGGTVGVVRKFRCKSKARP